MNVFISSSHSASFKLTTSMPRERRVSSPPTKVLFSPLGAGWSATQDGKAGHQMLIGEASLHHDAGNLVQYACSRAHVARAECRVHRRALIYFGGLAAEGLEGGHLGL